jgi:hypothetical protein
VADHVDRHAHDVGGEIAAVVEVEAAQEILIGLAVAGVLGDDHAGDRFQRLGRAQQGTVGELLVGDLPFGRRVGNACHILPAGTDSDFRQGRQAGGVDEPGQGHAQGQNAVPQGRQTRVLHDVLHKRLPAAGRCARRARHVVIAAPCIPADSPLPKPQRQARRHE